MNGQRIIPVGTELPAPARAAADSVTVKDMGGWSTRGVVEKHYSGEVPEVLERAMNQTASARARVG